MSDKTKMIIFSVIAGLFIVIALTSAVLLAVNVAVPLWLCIVLAVSEVALLVAGTIFFGKEIKPMISTKE